MFGPMRTPKLMSGEDPGGSGPPHSAPPPPQPNPPYADPSRYRKSPALAAVLSTFPGLGQVYVGYYTVGFLYLLIVASTITLLGRGAMRGSEVLLGLFLAFFWLYNIIDASRRATLFNRALEGDSHQVLDSLPDPMPGPVFGVGLIVFGFMALMGNLFEWDFEWLQDFWPVILIGAGVWITWRNRRERPHR